MLDWLKLSGILFFILFAFKISDHAQTFEKKDVPFAEPENPRRIAGEKSNLSNEAAAKQSDETPDAPNWKSRRGSKQINFEIGFSPFAPTNFNGREYDTNGRRFGAAAIRWGRIIGTKGPVTYEYLFEALPLIVAVKNEVKNPAYVSAAATPTLAPTVRRTTYGAGVLPLAFRFYFLPQRRIKPFIQIGAGAIYTEKPLPLPETSRFNFAGYFGGGFQVQTAPRRAVSFSYRYFHISNANMTRFNPGYNAQMFAVGYSFFYE